MSVGPLSVNLRFAQSQCPICPLSQAKLDDITCPTSQQNLACCDSYCHDGNLHTGLTRHLSFDSYVEKGRLPSDRNDFAHVQLMSVKNTTVVTVCSDSKTKKLVNLKFTATSAADQPEIAHHTPSQDIGISVPNVHTVCTVHCVRPIQQFYTY